MDQFGAETIDMFLMTYALRSLPYPTGAFRGRGRPGIDGNSIDPKEAFGVQRYLFGTHCLLWPLFSGYGCGNEME